MVAAARRCEPSKVWPTQLSAAHGGTVLMVKSRWTSLGITAGCVTMRRFRARLAHESRGPLGARFGRLIAVSLWATLACERGTSPARLPVMVTILNPSSDTLRSVGDSAILLLDVRDASG